MNILHLVVTTLCNRNCAWHCNRQYDIKNLEYVQAEQRRSEIEDQLTNSEYGIAYIDGTEKIVQLGHPIENNLLAQTDADLRWADMLCLTGGEPFEKRHCAKHMSDYGFEKLARQYLDDYSDWKGEKYETD